MQVRPPVKSLATVVYELVAQVNALEARVKQLEAKNVRYK